MFVNPASQSSDVLPGTSCRVETRYIFNDMQKYIQAIYMDAYINNEK